MKLSEVKALYEQETSSPNWFFKNIGKAGDLDTAINILKKAGITFEPKHTTYDYKREGNGTHSFYDVGGELKGTWNHGNSAVDAVNYNNLVHQSNNPGTA